MFNKITIGVLLAVALVVSMAGIAFAQEELPTDGECCPCPPPSFKPLEVAADALGMEARALRDALKDGQTIAELAEAQGVPLEDVAEALLDPVIYRIEKAVKEGQLSEEDAEERIANMTGRLVEALESGKWQQVLVRIARLPNWFPRWPLALLSEVLGMEADELHQALADGTSVAELAEQQGLAIDDVVDALIAPVGQRLAKAVEDGRITQADADDRLEHIAERLTRQIEEGEGLGPVGRVFARHPRVFKNLRQRLPWCGTRFPRQWTPAP